MLSNKRGKYSLADEKDIDRTEIKVIKEWERGKTVIGRVLAGVKLEPFRSVPDSKARWSPSDNIP